MISREFNTRPAFCIKIHADRPGWPGPSLYGMSERKTGGEKKPNHTRKTSNFLFFRFQELSLLSYLSVCWVGCILRETSKHDGNCNSIYLILGYNRSHCRCCRGQLRRLLVVPTPSTARWPPGATTRYQLNRGSNTTDWTHCRIFQVAQ
jgi:hypothetical protein